MKIITILLLMISTQILAENINGYPDDGNTVKQCNQIANISKRTIKAAISGVPIAEVIEKFGGIDTGGEPLLLPAVQNIVENTVDSKMDSYNPGKGASIQQGDTNFVPDSRNDGKITVIQKDEIMLGGLSTLNLTLSNGSPSHTIRAIYKTVDQIIKKHGVVRPQDRMKLNNRVDQKLIECRQMALDVLDNGFLID